MRAVNLRCEQLTNPIGIDIIRPRLSWAAENGVKQTAYEVVARKEGEEVPFFESGKVLTQDMFVRLDGTDILESRDRVCWSVRLWDENDRIGELSEAFFELGLLFPEDWKARWINVEQPHPEEERQRATYVKRLFFLEKTGDCARLYITCHGLYKAFLNGNPVQKAVLTPGVDDSTPWTLPPSISRTGFF